MSASTDISNDDERAKTEADRELDRLLAEADRRRARADIHFFIRNYLVTFDPRPEAYPHYLDFNPYDFQYDMIDTVVWHIENGVDLFEEKSRDMGASWVFLAVCFWMWLFKPGFQAKLGSRKEDYVDNWLPDSLFGKFDIMIDKIKDPQLLPSSFERTYMKLNNNDNGNSISGESANSNFARSGRYTVVLFDELGFWADAKSSWESAGESARCRVAITTPPNKPSFAKALRFGGQVKVVTYHWSLHPEKDQDWYSRQKARKSEDEMLHEIDISWEYTSKSRPYPEVDTVPFGHYPYDPKMPCAISIDLGLDAVALGWWQPVQNTNMWTLVEAFEKSDEMIDWFFPMFGANVDPSGKFIYTDSELAFIDKVSKWTINAFFGDPSGRQRHVESKESPYARMATKGFIVMVNDKANDWISRRDATKTLLKNIRVNDTPRTRWWQQCVKDAQYPQRPEGSQATTEITKPIHDHTSHHRTQTEYFAVNYKLRPLMMIEQQKHGSVRQRRYDASGRLLS